MQLRETQIFLSGLGDIEDHHVHVHHVHFYHVHDHHVHDHHVYEWERLCCLGGKKKMELEKKECYLAEGRTNKQTGEDRATKSAMDTEIEFRNFYQTHGSHGSDLWLSMSVSP